VAEAKEMGKESSITDAAQLALNGFFHCKMILSMKNPLQHYLDAMVMSAYSCQNFIVSST